MLRHAVGLLLLTTTPLLLKAQERFVSVGDVDLRLEVTGQGPAVVLLHGWANSLEAWHFLTPALAVDYTVIRYDRRGFGESGGSPDSSLDPIDLRTLLDSLGVDRAIVAGHSQGAQSALRFALEFPERLNALVLFGSGPPVGFGLRQTGPDAFPPGRARVAREEGLAAMRALFDGHPILDGFVEGTPGLEILTAMFEAYDGRDLLSPQPSVNATPAPDIGRLHEISFPTLVINGELEMPYFQVVAEALAYGIPNAMQVEVPGGGHSVQLQQPERFNAVFKRWIDSVSR